MNETENETDTTLRSTFSSLRKMLSGRVRCAAMARSSAARSHCGAGCAASEAAAGADIGATSLSALLSRHVLRDGETVILVLRPSIWFIVLSSLSFLMAVAILMIASKILDEQLPGRPASYYQAGVLLMAGRLMWATLQWMARIYILTDMRALRMSGVVRITIEDCPLRKVARVRLVLPPRERIAFAGSIEIIPFDDEHGDQHPIQLWQTVNRPRHVHEVINKAVSKARQGPK